MDLATAGGGVFLKSDPVRVERVKDLTVNKFKDLFTKCSSNCPCDGFYNIFFFSVFDFLLVLFL